jgi:anionic cell wall polymer biosynthesis LytR-Cps2A-Psr (LCP) family protein
VAAPEEPEKTDAPSILHTSLPDLTKLPDDKPAKPKKIKKIRSKKRRAVKWAALTVVLAILATGGFIGVKALNSINKVFHGNVISDVTAAFDSTPLKGESTGRVNILLAGDSVDDPDHSGADLTDSILICSIDLQDHTAFLLSIPRDLWVYVPGMNSY